MDIMIYEIIQNIFNLKQIQRTTKTLKYFHALSLMSQKMVVRHKFPDICYLKTKILRCCKSPSFPIYHECSVTFWQHSFSTVGMWKVSHVSWKCFRSGATFLSLQHLWEIWAVWQRGNVNINMEQIGAATTMLTGEECNFSQEMLFESCSRVQNER